MFSPDFSLTMATLHVVQNPRVMDKSHQGQRVSFFTFFYTLHGLHFLNEKKIKWFPLLTTTQKFTLQILFFDFSIKAQALLQTINLKSLQAKAQLKKSVVLTLNTAAASSLQLIDSSSSEKSHSFLHNKIHPTMCHLISIV